MIFCLFVLRASTIRGAPHSRCIFHCYRISFSINFHVPYISYPRVNIGRLIECNYFQSTCLTVLLFLPVYPPLTFSSRKPCSVLAGTLLWHINWIARADRVNFAFATSIPRARFQTGDIWRVSDACSVASWSNPPQSNLNRYTYTWSDACNCMGPSTSLQRSTYQQGFPEPNFPTHNLSSGFKKKNDIFSSLLNFTNFFL